MGSTRLQPRAATPRPPPTNADALLQLWEWFLPANILSGIKLHGNTNWKPHQLIELNWSLL